ncbi:MAG: hypothetical protein HYR96_06185 [Deltaproteobacteria bacterium]|nr:hypothetical protein [Deltaproteobacteria bacterium]MBI3295285.1 hypothetical protein [Deltaproteobacteria bacterium]
MSFNIYFLLAVFTWVGFADVIPNPATNVTCSGLYRCPQSPQALGEVNSHNYSASTQSACLLWLRYQVSQACPGSQPAEVYNVSYSSNPISLSSSVCPAFSTSEPYSVLYGSQAGFGAADGTSVQDAAGAAYRKCLSYPGATCRYQVIGPKFGCVGYYYSYQSGRDFFYTGCSVDEVRQRAQNSCSQLGCTEVGLRCPSRM